MVSKATLIEFCNASGRGVVYNRMAVYMAEIAKDD